jgi:hypothetical protein
MSQPLSRRDFLCTTAAVGALAGLGFATGCGGDESNVALLEQYPEFLGDAPAVRKLGKAYLEAHPAERDQRVLMNALFADLPKPWKSYSEEDLRRAVFDKVRADFVAGEIVLVRKWTLARSEARLLALHAL